MGGADAHQGVDRLMSGLMHTPLTETRIASLEQMGTDDAKRMAIADYLCEHTAPEEAIRMIMMMKDTRILKEIVSLTKNTSVRNAALDRVAAIEDDTLRS